MFGVAQFRPRIGEIDEGSFNALGRRVVAQEGRPFAAYGVQIGEIFSKTFEPNFPGAIKAQLDGDPIDRWVLFCALANPLPISAAKFHADGPVVAEEISPSKPLLLMVKLFWKIKEAL